MALESITASVDDFAQATKNSGISVGSNFSSLIPAALIGAGVVASIPLAIRSFDGTAIESGKAVTFFNGATAVGGFLGLYVAGSKLDKLGRPAHIAELLPAIIASGASAVAASFLFLPPNGWFNPITPALKKSGRLPE